MNREVLRFLQEEVKKGRIPGAVILVSHQGTVRMKESIGFRSIFPVKLPMLVDTLFDVASLTKVVTTLPGLLKLIDAGEVKLDDKVSYYLPKFGQSGKDEITIMHLLTHTSGLPAHRPFHLHYASPIDVFESIYAEPVVQPVGSGVIYSDLGFMVLSKLIEAVVRQKFADYIQQELFNPLEMKTATFRPSTTCENIAATEYSESLGEYKRGIVHDENAELLGGESGHAGLFATMHDLQNYTEMIENKGVYEGKQILSESILALSRQNFSPAGHENRGLGWALTNSSLMAQNHLDDQTYGHTGFTGTSLWFDPTQNLRILLLTNRVHLGRETPIHALRTELYKIIRTTLNESV